MSVTERWNLPLDEAVPSGEEGAALWAVSRHHKVPRGDAAISKMQIAHFLDFVSVDLDKGGEQGQTAGSALGPSAIQL